MNVNPMFFFYYLCGAISFTIIILTSMAVYYARRNSKIEREEQGREFQKRQLESKV